MTTLFLSVLAAMVAWVPVKQHAYLEPSDVTKARYVAIAQDIAQVVEEAEGERVKSAPFEALLLASIASFESAYREDVDKCHKGLGGAWSIFQIGGGGPRSKGHVCESRRYAARVALAMVRESFRVCVDFPFRDRLAFYTDGRCERRWWRSRSRVDRAEAKVWNDT